jgi:hypothetical protein
MPPASSDNRLAHIEKQIIGLEKDVGLASRLTEKFEITLEKMTEVSNSIRQLLAVHDSEIRAHHETDLDLYATIESSKKELLDQHKELVELIDKGMKAATEQIKALDTAVEARFIATASISTEHDRRIRGLERITFIGLGLAMLGGLIIDKIPWDKLF